MSQDRLSILLVEDELMVRLMVSVMIEELGHTLTAATGELAEAMTMARSAQFDLAVLDFNVNGQSVSPVIDVVQARRLPFVLATGYGPSGLPKDCRDYPILQKPFQIDALDQAMQASLNMHRNG